MPLLDIFFTIVWFYLFFIWIWLLIMVFSDVFRSDMSGIAKAAWTVLLIVLPLLGVLIYLIANGDDMRRRSAKDAAAAQQAQQDYIRSVAGGTSSPADELVKLRSLRDSGVLTEEEFQTQKAKLIA